MIRYVELFTYETCRMGPQHLQSRTTPYHTVPSQVARCNCVQPAYKPRASSLLRTEAGDLLLPRLCALAEALWSPLERGARRAALALRGSGSCRRTRRRAAWRYQYRAQGFEDCSEL